MAAERTNAFLGIGGNIGDVVQGMRRAIQALASHENIEVVSVSPVYKTPPWGKEDQDWFHNACLQVATTLSARQLLEVCLGIETAQDRKREERWGPRTIDLDILLFGDHVIDEPGLQVPHPRMGERVFVLQPLADLDDGLTVSGKTVLEMLAELGPTELEPLAFSPDWWQET